MKTKAQKSEEIKEAGELLSKNANLIFTDFTGVSFEFLKKLKAQLKKSGATFKVVKKRLLKVAMKEQGVEFDPVQFESQLGTIFIPGSLSESASVVYKFAKEVAKEKKSGKAGSGFAGEFKLLGAFDIKEKKFMTAEEFLVIAKLPSREVLLGMVLGGMTGPLRAFMYLLQELAKRTPATAGLPANAAGANENKTVEQTQ